METWPRQAWNTLRLATVLGAALMGVALVTPSVRAETADKVDTADKEEMAVIETRASIEEDSDGGVNAALKKALERAIRGASAMGLEQVQINGAFRAPGFVVVQILATPTGGVTSRRDGRGGGPDGPAPLPPVFPGKPERF
ncbi:MAG TPA: hypothetical protein VJU81_12270 [Methylomirabilota bacterium]|nr:hypothetical protein [Methylomirabilota bacterium]